MKRVPTSDAANGVSFTAADFVEASCIRLAIDVLAGKRNLDRTILEPIVNRTGLALTGFFECFAQDRVQIVGNSEAAYLRSLATAEQTDRFRALIEHGAWLFVFTDGNRPWKELLQLAEQSGAVLLATRLKTRFFAHHATFVLERLGAPRTSIYGTMVEVCGLGVLLEGDPGLGKSETALGLIKRGSALIADDLTCLRKDVVTEFLYGSASDSTQGYMEIRGIGIVHLPTVFGINSVRGEKRLQLVITFRRMCDLRGEIDRIGQVSSMRTILGVSVPNVIIPVSEGRDLVNLVETAAQQQKLKMAGYDPVADLSERLHLRAEASGSENWKGKRTWQKKK